MMQSPELYTAELEGKPLAALAELMARRAPEFSGEEDFFSASQTVVLLV